MNNVNACISTLIRGMMKDNELQNKKKQEWVVLQVFDLQFGFLVSSKHIRTLSSQFTIRIRKRKWSLHLPVPYESSSRFTLSSRHSGDNEERLPCSPLSSIVHYGMEVNEEKGSAPSGAKSQRCPVWMWVEAISFTWGILPPEKIVSPKLKYLLSKHIRRPPSRDSSISAGVVHGPHHTPNDRPSTTHGPRVAQRAVTKAWWKKNKNKLRI